MDADASHVFGNVADESIKDIWLRCNKELISKHEEHKWDELPEIRKNCIDWLVISEERFDGNGKPALKTIRIIPKCCNVCYICTFIVFN